MMLERLGLVGFFGILLPGTFLLACLVIQASIVVLAFEMRDPVQIFKIVQSNAVGISAAFLLISYLIGVVLRLPGADFVDRVSTFYFHRIRRAPINRENLWMYELFPYRWSIAQLHKRHRLSHIADFFKPYIRNRARIGSHPFLNYCKLVLQGNNLEMAQIALQAESMVRFLAGIAIALGFSAAIWIALATLVSVAAPTLALVCVAAASMSLLLLWMILSRFKFQRRREVQLVMGGTYLVLNGGASISGDRTPDSLREAVLGQIGDGGD